MSKKMTNFQIEELEQRFEMGWVDTVVVGGGPGPGTGQTGVPIGLDTPNVPNPDTPPPPKG